jgi:hypothetical protein
MVIFYSYVKLPEGKDWPWSEEELAKLQESQDTDSDDENQACGPGWNPPWSMAGKKRQTMADQWIWF